MNKSIVKTIDDLILMIDPDVQQLDIAHHLFHFSEILPIGELYSLIMDAYLLAKYNKFEKELQPCNKDDLLNRWNKIKSQQN